ncbi:alpha/beta fold hydrolase [Mucilaginibacter rubeus]|nr:alpha/beta hydrolase [Mucilaginibacter rubeus]
MKTNQKFIDQVSFAEREQQIAGASKRGAGIMMCLLALLITVFFYTPVSAQRFSKKALSDEELVKKMPGFKNGFATVNGVKLHYVAGGTGKALVLLPGWPETWWSYSKIMPALASKYHVIAIDYRGMGTSDKPAEGYDKKTIAGDIYGLLHQLGYEKAFIAGHDIGAQVAFSVAANHSELVEKLIIMDVPHPDESFAAVLMLPALGTPTDKLDPARPFLWWFAFNQMRGLPEDLLEGRFEMAQKYIFHYLLADDRSIGPFDRAVYANAYNTRDAIRAGNGWYQAFSKDIADYKTYEKLTMPVLGIGGPGYDWLRFTLPNKTTDLKIEKIENSGHFIAEEQPETVIRDILQFLN